MENDISVSVYTKAFKINTFGRSPMTTEKRQKIPSVKKVKLFPKPKDLENAKTWQLRSSHHTEIDNEGFALCESEYTLDKVFERLEKLETKVETQETKIEKLQYFQDQMTIREVLYVAQIN